LKVEACGLFGGALIVRDRERRASLKEWVYLARERKDMGVGNGQER
jgi:hypothetical protein